MSRRRAGTTVTTALLAALAALVLAAAGCGPSSSLAPSSAAPTTAAPTTVAPTSPSPSPSAATGASPSATQTPTEGRFLGDVELADGRRLHMACAGSGWPTVILDAGYNSRLEDWSHVFSKVAEITHVCAYDRAGVGGSFSALEGSKTTTDIVDDLRELVATSGIPTPYVLVGHSIAGLHLRLMGGHYPDDLAGIVFVDPSVPEQLEAWRAALPAAAPNDPDWLTELRADLAQGWPAADEGERYDVAADIARVDAVTTFGDLPVIVLTAGIQTVVPAGDPMGVELQAVWYDLHEALSSMSTKGRHDLVAGARHFIQSDRPDVVVDAVRELVDLARGR